MLSYILLSFFFVQSIAEQNIDGVISVDFQKVSHPLAEDHVFKRAASSSSSPKHSPKDYLTHISNQRFFYTSDVQIGTPGQKQTLLMDTGSSDTWVMGTSNAGGQVYDPSQSKTYHANNTNWQIQYGIGSASGSWGTDTILIGGAKVNHLSFGQATQVNQIQQGLIGLGRKQAENTNHQGYTYNNLPFQMKQQGLIGSAAYSLFMNDIDATSGSILFGGVDHSKYKGQLVSLPVTHPRHLGVDLHGIYSDGRASENNMQGKTIAVLDSGTSLSYVDSDTLGNIRDALNANPSFAMQERYYCDCNITENLIFDFGETKVAVPAYNFLWPIDQFVSGQVAAAQFPQNSCYLGIEQSSPGENFFLLGDNVLRGMYVVYDLDNNQVAVAQAADKGSPQVEAISGPRIPGTNAAFMVKDTEDGTSITKMVYN